MARTAMRLRRIEKAGAPLGPGPHERLVRSRTGPEGTSRSGRACCTLPWCRPLLRFRAEVLQVVLGGRGLVEPPLRVLAFHDGGAYDLPPDLGAAGRKALRGEGHRRRQRSPPDHVLLPVASPPSPCSDCRIRSGHGTSGSLQASGACVWRGPLIPYPATVFLRTHDGRCRDVNVCHVAYISGT